MVLCVVFVGGVFWVWFYSCGVCGACLVVGPHKKNVCCVGCVLRGAWLFPESRESLLETQTRGTEKKQRERETLVRVPNVWCAVFVGGGSHVGWRA